MCHGSRSFGLSFLPLLCAVWEVYRRFGCQRCAYTWLESSAASRCQERKIQRAGGRAFHLLQLRNRVKQGSNRADRADRQLLQPRNRVEQGSDRADRADRQLRKLLPGETRVSAGHWHSSLDTLPAGSIPRRAAGRSGVRAGRTARESQEGEPVQPVTWK